MSDEDVFDLVIADTIDVNVSPHGKGDSPIVSSGVSSQEPGPIPIPRPNSDSPQVPPQAAPAKTGKPETDLMHCPYDRCKKTYKTKKGYDNHIFVHEISDYNVRKPSLEGVISVVDDFVVEILEGIKKEPCPQEDKLKILEEMLASHGSSNWVHFCQAISEPVLNALTERTKLLPSNQYEEFLTKLNQLFNNEIIMSDLKTKIEILLSDASLTCSKFVGMILFRLCSKLGEVVQTFIVKEMSRKSNALVPNEIAPPVMNEEQERLFSKQISSIIRCYFTTAASLETEIWKIRCECIRQRFVKCKDYSTARKSDIVKKSCWDEGILAPSKDLFDFCCHVESIVSVEIHSEKGRLSSDSIIKSLFEPCNRGSLAQWHSLTVGYFGEVDSIIFMREIVTILVKQSVRAEEKRIKRAEEEHKQLQKFATRVNLKRNK